MFVLLGSAGQITSRLARLLLAAGHPVRVVGRNADALAPLTSAGAEAVVGDPADPALLARAFTGASAVYTMIPPCYAEPDMRVAQDRIGAAIADALVRARVPRVVNLSSTGAELPAGTGPIEGLHAQEQRLNAIRGIDLLHLRPGSFMDNLLAAAPEIAQTGTMSGMESADAAIPMVATRDVAAVAARELTAPRHTGVLLLHAPGLVTMSAAAAALGAAIGKPDLRYVRTAPDEAKAALRSLGFSADAADQLERLARWLSTTSLDSVDAGPVAVQPTTIEAFARECFAPAYARLSAQ
ncbi:MAG: NAD(P)H-binding protein [Burkholderiaceae bacterium]